MRIDEALSVLGISQSALYRYVRNGAVRSLLLSPRRRDFNREDIFTLKESIRQERGRRDKKPDFSQEDIIHRLSFDIEELRRQDRSRPVTDRRRIAAFIMREQGYALNQIGEFLHRTHATVINLLNTSYLVEKEINEAMRQFNTETGYGKEKKT